MIAGVVDHHIEDDLDPGLVKGVHQLLEIDTRPFRPFGMDDDVAEVVDAEATQGGDRVVLGAAVTVRLEPEGVPIRYRIVGENEADVRMGKISVEAPLARALLGCEEGQSITVETPGGTTHFRILEIDVRRPIL